MLIAIIADADHSACQLRLLLARDAGVRVVAVCGTGPAAIDAIHRFRPDIAFTAVDLPLLNGLDVARSIAPSVTPGFVFLTSDPRDALAAFSLNALDCLALPVDRRRLAVTLRRAHRRLTPQRVSALMLEAAAESLRDVKRLVSDAARRSDQLQSFLDADCADEKRIGADERNGRKTK
jgi:two-component system LytT family response regulator